LRRVLAAVLAVAVFSLLVTLPFRWLVPPTTAFIQRAANSGLAAQPPCATVTRQWVNLEHIAPVMPLAVVAAEDQRFPVHRGLDLEAIATAVQERRKAGRVRGASTITQQLVKNLYLWPRQSLGRKALEAWLTLTLEATWSKRRILEVYLNVVQFGDCTFGVQAASQRFFRKSAADLTDREAARLAASLPNPVRYRVDRPTDYTQERVSWILEQMRLLGGTNYLRGL